MHDTHRVMYFRAPGVVSGLCISNSNYRSGESRPDWLRLVSILKTKLGPQVAIREYKKKFGAQPTAMSIKQRAKRVRYLQSRGFTSDIIKVTLAKISDAETTSDAEG